MAQIRRPPAVAPSPDPDRALDPRLHLDQGPPGRAGAGAPRRAREPGGDRGDPRAVRARQAHLHPVLEVREDDGSGRPGHERHDAAAGRRRARAALPGDDRARDLGADLRDAPGDPTRLRRREEVRNRDRPREPRPLPARDLDPGLLPRDPAQVRLRGEARVVTHGRAYRRADRSRAPDELLPARRSSRGRPPGVLGRQQNT